ncbi:P-loop NTPase fold protein [Streptomyces sp. Root369]|uniref:P-loop NTPase fold protein n=1 Tax=Streptomyces sp. Root369 TaxID=1736523 RepID=UPI0024121E8B|nr:P-loop NTPase fold protein [Streptomyces sp. Root369]
MPLEPTFERRIEQLISGLETGEIRTAPAESEAADTNLSPPDSSSEAPVQLTLVRVLRIGARVAALAVGELEGRTVAVTGDEDATVQAWDAATGARRAPPLLGHRGPVWAVALGELDARTVAVTGGEDAAVRVWDLAAGNLLTTLTGHTAPVNAVAVGDAADGRLIALSASDDRTIRLWDIASGQEIGTLAGHTDWVNSVACGTLHDGRLAAISGSADRTVRIWDLATGQVVSILAGHTGSVSSVAFGAIEGTLFTASGSTDRTVRIWDPESGHQLETFTGHTDRVRTVAVTILDGRPVTVSGSNDSTVRVWRGGDNSEVVLLGHAAPVRAVAVGALDGMPIVASGSDDGTVHVWGPAPVPDLGDQVEWLSDVPAQLDLLRRRPLAEALAVRLRRIQNEEPGTSFLIHIDGAWGTGKSTLLNFLRLELNPDWVTVDFDAWRQARVGPAWWALLSALRVDIARNAKFWERAWLRVTESWMRLRRAGAPFVFAVVLLLIVASAVFLLIRPQELALKTAAETVTAVISALGTLWVGALVAGRFLLWDSARGARLFEQSNADPMRDISDHFGWLVGKARRPVVIFVDDLDRCSEGYVVELLEAVQTLIRDAPQQRSSDSTKETSTVSFVFAADGAWIRKSYEIAYEKFTETVAEPGRPLGYLFLDKLFQLRVPVPSIDAPRQQEYLSSLLRVRTSEGSRQLIHEEQEVRESLQRSSTDAEVVEKLNQASPEVRDRVAGAAVERLTTREVEAATEHSLQRFGPLLAPNPRSMKRFVNSYSVLRAVRILEGNTVPLDPLALWTILETRWPSLADHLRVQPDAITLLGTTNDEAMPIELRSLFDDHEVCRLVGYEHGGPLTPDLVRACCGAVLPKERAQ